MNRYKISFGLKVTGVLMFVCLLVMAQDTTGQISGTVKDQFGGGIPATLIIKNQTTGAERKVTTNDSGIFGASVPSGLYEVTVLIPAFKVNKKTVRVGRGQSQTINFTFNIGYITDTHKDVIAMIGPEPPPVIATPVALTWNAWTEPESPEPSFSPEPFLKPDGKTYSLFLDLAAFAYRDVPFSRRAVSQLNDWLLKSKAPTVNLKLVIIPDERFFKTARRTETFPIKLDRLRKALNEGVEVLETPLATLQQKKEADFSFGQIPIQIRTLNQEGLGSVAISLWADGVMPIDELSIPLCVAANEMVALAKCKTANKLHDSLAGIDPLRAAAQQEAFALKPDAALHFIELDSFTQIGIFRDNSWPEGEYKTWRLSKSAKAIKEDLQKTILPNFDRATNNDHLLRVGTELYNLLFPRDESDARESFAAFIGRQRNRNDPTNPPSIFIRMLSTDNEEPPFLIPLGIMVHNIDEGKDFLGFHFRIQTPLHIQDYEPYPKCIGSWVVLAPPANASGIPAELNDARARFSTWFETWDFKPIPEMEDFIDWVQEAVNETEPLSLFILAHQASNSLYFEENPRLGPSGIQRRFKTPSVAIVNGCETGAPGTSAIVQKLNENGVSAVIATAGKVHKHLAGDFFSVLGRHLTANPAGQEYSLGIAHFLTLRELQNRKPTLNSLPYGAKVLAYEVMGNSSLRICSPPLKPREGQ